MRAERHESGEGEQSSADPVEQLRGQLEALRSAVAELAGEGGLPEELRARLAAIPSIGAEPSAAAGPSPRDAEEPEPLPIDWSTEPTPAAANGLQILHKPNEFAVIYTDMTPFPGRRAEGGAVGKERAVIVSSLRIAPDTFFQMMCAMANSWNRYSATMIDPRMRQPRFKLLDAGELQLDDISKEH